MGLNAAQGENYFYLCGKSFSKIRSYGSELFKTVRVAYQHVVE